MTSYAILVDHVDKRCTHELVLFQYWLQTIVLIWSIHTKLVNSASYFEIKISIEHDLSTINESVPIN